MSESSWSDERREAARLHAEALERAEHEESAQAHAMLVDFAHEAVARGIPQVPLVARSYQGTGRYPTDVTGWYLRQNGSVGADADGNFYVLTVPGGPFARWRKTHLDPRPAPLVVGKGGRDGESVDMKDLVALRLEAGNNWPAP